MKLLLLLQSLQPNEYKDFEKFLQSPFFKVSEQYLKFFRFLCKHHPTFELERAELQKAYRRCFGPESLNDSKLYNLLSGLSKQLEQFLVVQMVLSGEDKADPGLKDQLLSKSLGLRNMGAYFRTEALQLIEEITTRPVRESDDYLAIQQLHYQIYFNPDTPKFVEYSPHLLLANEHLDLYFCLTKLRYAAEMKTRERIFNTRYELPLLEAVLKYCTASGLVDAHPLLRIYYQLVQIFLHDVDEPGFRELIITFNREFEVLPKADQNELLQLLINCGIFLLARDANVEAEILDLYKLAIVKDKLLDGNRITHPTFVNITTLASQQREFDWAQKFITDFSPYLEESKRQPTVELAMAVFYYCQDRLDKAQNCLNNEKIFQIPAFDLLAKGLLLKIVFDRYIRSGEDYAFLTAYLRSLVKFVRAKSLSPEKITAQLSWIGFVRKMTVMKFKLVEVPASKKTLLRKELHHLQLVINKKWLRERIDAL